MFWKRSGLYLLGLIVAFYLGALIYGGFYTTQIEVNNPQSGTILRTKGADTNVVIEGVAGPTVLLIHGAGANAREFELTLLPRLASSNIVLAADRPGHGYSERVPEAHTLRVQAAQMASVLEQLSSAQPVTVVGHSYGSAVALRLALDRPDLVRSLVLLAPVSHDWGPDKVAWYNAAAATPLVGTVFSQLMPIFGPDEARAGMSYSFKPAPEPPEFFDKAGVGLLFRPANFRANAQELSALRSELVAQQDRYGELKMPLVIVYGSADQTMDPAFHVEQLEQQVSNVRSIPFDDEGHIPHYRKADFVSELIAQIANEPELDGKGASRLDNTYTE